MPVPERDPEERLKEGQQFRTTHWSIVLAAGDSAAPEAEGALEKLCQVYWYPLYAFTRRRGYDAHEAQDLTQDFFCRFLESKALKSVHPEKGRFRSFLLAALKNFLTNEWDRANRLKRGGGREILSWDGLEAEERYALEPAEDLATDKWFDRNWAQSLVNATMARLRAECAAEETEQRFELLRHFLGGDSSGLSYATAGERLGLSENAVKSAIHRLRQRYAALFRAEVAQTVANPIDVESEIRHLFGALSE
jgi:RNA polymerase sigma-70 factor (ECF subfamily)